MASGGCGDSAGAVILVGEGDPTSIRKASAIVESVKGAPAQIEKTKIPGVTHCLYAGKREEDLPSYLKG